MKDLTRLTFAVVTFLALAVDGARAQTSITQPLVFTAAENVLYLPFHVSIGGDFDIRTFGGVQDFMDPYLHLYAGYATEGSALGSLLAFHDDIVLGVDVNSQMNLGLAPGYYTLAASFFDFSEADARDGFNDDVAVNTTCLEHGGSCTYDVAITSTTGQATVTPEPATVLLLASGLAGAVAAGKRRRNS